MAAVGVEAEGNGEVVGDGAGHVAEGGKDVGAVIAALGDEGGDVGFGGEDVGRKGLAILAEVGRIDEEGECETVVFLGEEACGEVSACGEADHADGVWADMPGGGVFTKQGKRLAGILEGAFAVIGDAVFENGGMKAEGVEPAADFEAFFVVGEDLIGAAGGNEDDGRGLAFWEGGGEEFEGGAADVLEVAVDNGFRLGGNGARGALGPEREGRMGVEGGGEGEEECCGAGAQGEGLHGNSFKWVG